MLRGKHSAWDHQPKADASRSYMRNNADLADELEKKIKERMGIGPKIDLPAGIDPVTGEVEF